MGCVIPTFSLECCDEHMPPWVRVLCKLQRVVIVLLTVMFPQGLNYARAYIPDAIWYDYETVSESRVLGVG